jgi:pimeloyl-ACP methyl ester carboxylesterase
MNFERDTESHSVDLGDVRLHYRRAGSGKRETVLLIHGWPQTSRAWSKVAPLLDQYDLIMPDLRGLGDSSIAAHGYDKKTLAADLCKLVTGTLGIREMFVVGHDWGGVVAFFAAAALEKQCLGMAMLDVTVPGSPSISFGQDGKRWHHQFHQTDGLAQMLIGGNERAYFSWFFRTFGFREDAVHPDDIEEYLRTYSEPERLSAILAYYRTIPEDIENAREIQRKKLAMPVLGLGGADSFGRGGEPVKSLTDYSNDVHGGAIAECGHWIPEEQPEVLAEKLEQFFSYCRFRRHAEAS